MPAGPIGACWKAGSWSDLAWEANTWAGAGAAAVTFNDLTTIWCQDYQPVLSVNGLDDPTLIAKDLHNVLPFDDDLNTAYAAYITANF
jgi:hypothetical protein